MERDIVIICEGGCMLGAFGVGVLKAFKDADIYNRVDSIYAVSAGSADSAAFLSRNIELESTIYYDDLINGRFIHYGKTGDYVRRMLLSIFRKKEKRIDLIDIDYFKDLYTKEKPMNFKNIKNSKSKFYARVFDIDSLEWVFLDAKKDTPDVLKASCDTAPFYTHAVNLHGKRFIDGELLQTKNFLEIIEKNLDKTVIYVINDQKNIFRKLLEVHMFLLVPLFLWILFGRKLAWKYIKTYFNYVKLSDLKKFPNVKVLMNNQLHSKGCTDRKKILGLYNYGIKKGEEVLKKL